MKHNQGSRHPGQALLIRLIRLTSLHFEEAFKKYRDRHKTPHFAVDSAASILPVDMRTGGYRRLSEQD
jgi:hypothetical protein